MKDESCLLQAFNFLSIKPLNLSYKKDEAASSVPVERKQDTTWGQQILSFSLWQANKVSQRAKRLYFYFPFIYLVIFDLSCKEYCCQTIALIKEKLVFGFFYSCKKKRGGFFFDFFFFIFALEFSKNTKVHGIFLKVAEKGSSSSSSFSPSISLECYMTTFVQNLYTRKCRKNNELNKIHFQSI